LIGNGYYDPLIMARSYYNFTVFPGNTYDYTPFNTSVESQMYSSLYGPGNCLDQLEDCANRGIDEICLGAANFCGNEVEGLYGNRDYYDIREPTDPIPYQFFSDYLETSAVQSAIGAYVNFSTFSSSVGTDFGATGDEARNELSVQDLTKLLEQGVTVVMYNGDADYICNWFSGEEASNQVGAAGFSEAGYVNISTSDNIVHGQVRQSGSFSFVRIYESGHLVPYFQPLVSLAMFERAITGKDIAMGTIDITESYRTIGSAKSTFRQGNSTIKFSVENSTETYNGTTNTPSPLSKSTSGSARQHMSKLFLVSIMLMLMSTSFIMSYDDL
jgi:carboxypeptidase C (cathepsin A)